MAINPPIHRQKYSHQLPGIYGEFGAGAGLRAFYLQSTIAPAELNRVSLISDISGSERWPVRDLFQRDVDNERITEKLLPYLQDDGKIKFFNPLTLTVLPMADHGNAVLAEMPAIVESQLQEGGPYRKCLTQDGYYRVRWIDEDPQYALLEWDDTRTRLVAIDGQHRLSALKRYAHDANSNTHAHFSTWRIPIVVVCFRAAVGGDELPRVLDVVRNIFVYINTAAKEVNKARQILLRDDSVNCLGTQELLDRSHRNDLTAAGDRDMNRLPLLFFDWRGEESSEQRVHAPAAVKTIEEIHGWFEYYILDEDFSHEQELALGINPAHLLHAHFHNNRERDTKKLDHAASDAVRELLNERVLPAVSHVLENFIPCRTYTADLRELEREYNRKSDLSRHAFYELRFGTNPAMDANKEAVERILVDLKKLIGSKRDNHFQGLFSLDIGMRGVMYAFGHLRVMLGYPDWMEYATWFTKALNCAYEATWFGLEGRAIGRGHLVQIAKDHNDRIINYRLENDVPSALGTYTSLVVAEYGRPWPEEWAHEESVLRERFLETLNGTVYRGYRKQARPELREEYPMGGTELTKAVNARARKLAGSHIRRLEQALRKIEQSQDRSADQ